MDLLGLLGFDLAGKFSALKRKYDKGSIDESKVWCNVTRWGNGEITISASAEIVELNWSTVGANRYVQFYDGGRFKSLVEAVAHEEAEIRRATKKHPHTRFYRDRIVKVVENGRLGEEDVYVPEYCLDGVWHHADV